MNITEIFPFLGPFNGFANLYIEMFTVGLFYGASMCSLSCLPYIGTYIMGKQEGFVKGIKSTLIFSISKLVTYSILGGLCGYIGNVILEKINPEEILIISGIVIILIGIILVIKPYQSCPSVPSNKISKTISLKNPYLHLISMGIVVSLIPCFPLTAVLLYSATTLSVFKGILIAMLFGLGTIISPLFLFGGIAGWLSKRIGHKIPKYRGLLQKISGLILAFLGFRLLFEAL